MDVTHRNDDRKHEFLAVALELFYEKGYEKTTIKDIIERMGVSKGAFYHYFQSKEDVIVSISKEYVDRAIGIMKGIAKRKDLNAIEKINKIFEYVNEYKGNSERQRSKIKGIFNDEGNLKLERKITKAIRPDFLILIKEIIDQGVEEGTIKTSKPIELSEFFTGIINSLDSSIDELVRELYDTNYQEFVRRLDEKLQFHEIMLKRIFDLEDQLIELRQSYLKRFLKA
ncbi:UNVERIFIED_CONTAM: TetR family transcriptional regulator [Acetivibrio alkalicellulosi]